MSFADYRRKPQAGDEGGGENGAGFEGGGYRAKPKRPVVDYGSTAERGEMAQRRRQGVEYEDPSPSYLIDMQLPEARETDPAGTIPAKHLHSSLNKVKHPVNVVKWTPEGRRLLTGNSQGEFTLWNGQAFNFETIMSAHDDHVRACVWNGSAEWLLSCDQAGFIKYWQPNFNNVKAVDAHPRAAVRDIAFAPTDTKFVSGSDDGLLKIWDFARAEEEKELKAHGWDVKTCDWHPERGLIVSGSKDHTIKLWDPRTANCLTTLHGHKTTVRKTRFGGRNAMLIATCAADNTARIFDLKMMRDMLLLRGHEKDITTLTWHPIHETLISTGSNDGAIFHYILDSPNVPEGQPMSLSPYDAPDPQSAPTENIYPTHKVPFAHESAVWSLDWHPEGHILASGSNDRATRFWTRPRPGDTSWPNDHWHKGPDATTATSWRLGGPPSKRGAAAGEDGGDDDDNDGLVDQKMPSQQPGGLPGLAGLPGLGGTNPGAAAGAPNAPPSDAFQRAMGLAGLPPPPMQAPGQPPFPFPGFPPPPPGQAGQGPPPLPAGATFAPPPPGWRPPPGMTVPPPPPQFQGQGGLPPGFPPFPQQQGGVPPPPPGFPGGPPPGFQPPPGMQQQQLDNARRRSPLPSQQDSYRHTR